MMADQQMARLTVQSLHGASDRQHYTDDEHIICPIPSQTFHPWLTVCNFNQYEKKRLVKLVIVYGMFLSTTQYQWAHTCSMKMVFVMVKKQNRNPVPEAPDDKTSLWKATLSLGWIPGLGFNWRSITHPNFLCSLSWWCPLRRSGTSSISKPTNHSPQNNWQIRSPLGWGRHLTITT